jgi:hypothetical protein
VAFLFFVIGVVRWLSSPTTAQGDFTEDLSVEAQWNITISRLGIEPVYPPQEDIAVGDVYAVVVGGKGRLTDLQPQEKIANSEPFLRKAIKLAHVPVQDQLREAYSFLPVFPEFGQSDQRGAANNGSKRDDRPEANDLFRNGQRRTALPQAAFPGISISFTGSAAVGGAVGSRGMLGLFSYGASHKAEQKVELRSVETYGLPSLIAYEALKSYCSKQLNVEVCTEKTARQHLKSVFSHILDQSYNPNKGELYYNYPVRIIMIDRVFYAREILERSVAESAESGSGSGGLERGASDNRSAPSGGAPTQPSVTPGDRTSEAISALEGRLNDLDKRLATIQQGSAVEYRSQNGREILLDQKFSRPIAFGYRSVVYDFSDQVTKPADKSANKE